MALITEDYVTFLRQRVTKNKKRLSTRVCAISAPALNQTVQSWRNNEELI